MARLLTAGAEFGHPHPDSLTIFGAGTVINTTTVRSGTGAYTVPISTGHYLRHDWTSAPNRWFYLRAWFRISALPNTLRTLLTVRSSSVTLNNITLQTSGKLIITGHPTTAQLSPAIAPGEWHRLELGFWGDGTTTRSFRIRLDGIQFDGFDTSSSANLLADSLLFGNLGTVTPAEPAIAYWDDLAINDDTGTDENSWPHPNGKIIVLRPVADIAAGNWNLGTGTTVGNRYDSVDNTPPLGVTNAAVGSDPKQIRNAVASTTRPASDIDLRLEPYSAKVPAAHTVKLAQAIGEVGHSAGAATTANLEIGLLSSPAETTPAAITLSAQGAGGTYPTNWVKAAGNPNHNPAIARTDQPVIRLSRRNALTDTLLCCALGATVEYEPDPASARKFLAVA